MAGKAETRWCAVYTRKSSDAGLEQGFNSLDAQREAALAFIASQKHEGWKALKKHYDDGGFSGGTMERPALHELLSDIAAGRVHTVVVYKVDRLTRSLPDFARIIELFDQHDVSFVAVTQQFNTTTSMGRLTLNVLLSFAQFEREVTGERIRDKFLQSRRKGMWMGGSPPLGYDIDNRRLLINEEEARTVRYIFEQFVSLGSIASLRDDLKRGNITTKRWTSARGVAHGGTSFSRGHLYRILKNRLYLGEAVHKGTAYCGEHEAIVPDTLWHQVQGVFATEAEARRPERLESGALLQGLLYDDAGNRMTPSYTAKRGCRYRYYVSQATLQRTPERAGSVHRIPALEIEQAVLAAIEAHDEQVVGDPGCALHQFVERVMVSRNQIEIVPRTDSPSIRAPFYVRGKGPASETHSNPVVQSHLAFERTLARAWSWRRRIEKGEFSTLREIAREERVTSRYVARVLRAAYLPPSAMARAFSRERDKYDPTLEGLRKPIALRWP